MCFNARVQNRAKSRCKMACSTPPIYWPTGIHFSTVSLSKGLSPGWLAKRMKYQLESTNVWSVSVSRRAARSEEQTSEIQSLMRISYAVLCLKQMTTKYTCTITSYQINTTTE